MKLTGGEPLLHPQIFRVFDSIRERNLRLTMETNGTHCSAEIAASLGGFADVSVSVSLDGADAETHDVIRGKAGCFEETLAGIGHLVKNGIRPQIILTVNGAQQGPAGGSGPSGRDPGRADRSNSMYSSRRRGGNASMKRANRLAWRN